MDASLLGLEGDGRRVRREKRIRAIFWAAGLSTLLISVAIIVSLTANTVTFLSNIDLSELWTFDTWSPRVGKFDIATLFVGSLMVTVVAMVIAIPLGLGAAIYLAEYAKPRVRRVLKPILEVLAGIPSIVLGFFAITWLGPNIVVDLMSGPSDFSLITAGLGVGILVTPLVASVSEDAMRAVPNALREASYGMGARRMTTVVRIVIPAAISGIVAALMLAMARAIGETMVIALSAGAAGEGHFTVNPFDPGLTVTSAMASVAAGTDQIRGAGQAFNSLFFLGIALFTVTLVINMIGNYFVRRVREKY